MSNELSSPLAPVAIPAEYSPNTYEAKLAPNAPGGRGPLRFEEGLATDTDIPGDFQVGIMQGYITPPGQPNHNTNVYVKTAEETVKERAHMGSASWVEAPTYLGGFAGGAGPEAEVKFVMVDRTGESNLRRHNAATVID